MANPRITSIESSTGSLPKNMIRLDLTENSVQTIDLSGANSLQELDLNKNNIQSPLDIRQVDQTLTSINVQVNPYLAEINFNSLPNVSYFNGFACAFDKNMVNDILIALDNNGIDLGGFCELSGIGNAAPDAPGLAAAASLQLKSWYVSYNT